MDLLDALVIQKILSYSVDYVFLCSLIPDPTLKHCLGKKYGQILCLWPNICLTDTSGAMGSFVFLIKHCEVLKIAKSFVDHQRLNAVLSNCRNKIVKLKIDPTQISVLRLDTQNRWIIKLDFKNFDFVFLKKCLDWNCFGHPMTIKGRTIFCGLLHCLYKGINTMNKTKFIQSTRTPIGSQIIIQQLKNLLMTFTENKIVDRLFLTLEITDPDGMELWVTIKQIGYRSACEWFDGLDTVGQWIQKITELDSEIVSWEKSINIHF
jgi:hypothetical protein